MTALLLIAHAPLASALKAVAEHTSIEAASRVLALDVTPDMSIEDVQLRAQALLAQLNAESTLVLTDVFGATPMLWRALWYADEPLDMLVQRAMAGATQGVMHASPSRPQQQAQRDTPDAEDPRHHHQ
jgi:PTS system mannose-specific IIA component